MGLKNKLFENLDSRDNFLLFKVLDDNSYLQLAYDNIQKSVECLDNKLKERFLKYPSSEKIIKEYNKVFQ